jgi:DNA repair exonuclease SbcCD nuclease subunit
MPRLSFLFRTDVHTADRSPASWKGDYPEEIWASLEEIGTFARKHEVNAVLDGGDYFHVKTASRNSHAMLERTARIHRRYPCPVYCIEGNHDISYNNLDTVSKQPLGVLYASNVFQHLREEVFRDGDLQVRVVGVPYSPERSLEDMYRLQKQPGDTHLIAVVHALAAKDPPPQVEDFFNEPVFRYESLVRRNGPDVFMFGHWHRDQGVEVIRDCHFINQGAVSRGALVRENLQRTPQVAHIVFDGGEVSVQLLPLSVAPAEEVFDLEKKANEEREHKDIDQFVKRLLTDVTFDTEALVEDNIKALNFAQEVRQEALRYYELAEAK